MGPPSGSLFCLQLQEALALQEEAAAAAAAGSLAAPVMAEPNGAPNRGRTKKKH